MQTQIPPASTVLWVCLTYTRRKLCHFQAPVPQGHLLLLARKHPTGQSTTDILALQCNEAPSSREVGEGASYLGVQYGHRTPMQLCLSPMHIILFLYFSH